MFLKLLKDLMHQDGLFKSGNVVDTDELQISDKELATLREHNVFIELTEDETEFHSFKILSGYSEADDKIVGGATSQDGGANK